MNTNNSVGLHGKPMISQSSVTSLPLDHTLQAPLPNLHKFVLCSTNLIPHMDERNSVWSRLEEPKCTSAPALPSTDIDASGLRLHGSNGAGRHSQQVDETGNFFHEHPSDGRSIYAPGEIRQRLEEISTLSPKRVEARGSRTAVFRLRREKEGPRHKLTERRHTVRSLVNGVVGATRPSQ